MPPIPPARATECAGQHLVAPARPFRFRTRCAPRHVDVRGRPPMSVALRRPRAAAWSPGFVDGDGAGFCAEYHAIQLARLIDGQIAASHASSTFCTSRSYGSPPPPAASLRGRITSPGPYITIGHAEIFFAVGAPGWGKTAIRRPPCRPARPIGEERERSRLRAVTSVPRRRHAKFHHRSKPAAILAGAGAAWHHAIARDADRHFGFVDFDWRVARNATSHPMRPEPSGRSPCRPRRRPPV